MGMASSSPQHMVSDASHRAALHDVEPHAVDPNGGAPRCLAAVARRGRRVWYLVLGQRGRVGGWWGGLGCEFCGVDFAGMPHSRVTPPLVHNAFTP